MMRGTLAIFTRELAARRDVLWLAAVVAVLAILVPWIPGVEARDPSEIRIVTSAVNSLVVGLLLAAAFGVGLIGRDLSENRLGFYLARPVSGVAIWVGKLVAAMLLILGCEVVAGLPALLLWRPMAAEHEVWWLPLVVYVAVPLTLLLLAHAVGVMVRARTAWLALDLVGAVAVAVVGWLTIRPLVALEADTAVAVVAAAFASALAVALVAAGAVQVTSGRADLGRSHRALSLALWSVLACGTAGAAGYGWWLQSFTAHNLELEGYPHVSPDGRWLVVSGTAPGRLDVVRGFLCSADGRRQIALPSRARWDAPRVSFADDGGVAIWFEGERGRGRLMFIDLSVEDPRAVPTTVVVSRVSGFALTPDGRRLADLAEGLLSVTTLPEGRLETAIRVPPDLREAWVDWLDEGRLRLVKRVDDGEGAAVFRRAVVDLETGRVRRMADLPNVGSSTRLRFDARRGLVLVSGRDSDAEPPRQELREVESGRVLRTLDPEHDGLVECFLADGRLLGVRRLSAGTALLVATSVDGAEREVHEVPWSENIDVRGELRPGLLLLSSTGGSWELWRFEVLDLATGQRRLVGEGLLWYWEDLSGGGPVARLLLLGDDGLLAWDEVSGELTPFAPWLRG